MAAGQSLGCTGATHPCSGVADLKLGNGREGRPAWGELSLQKCTLPLAQDTKHRACWVAASRRQQLGTARAVIPKAFWHSMSADPWL